MNHSTHELRERARAEGVIAARETRRRKAIMTYTKIIRDLESSAPGVERDNLLESFKQKLFNLEKN